jgi:hypothetical protein
MKEAIKILSNKKLGVLIVQNKQKKQLVLLLMVKLEGLIKKKNLHL